jgi:hypothetical protein
MEYACTAGFRSSLKVVRKDVFASVTSEFQWPGLNFANPDGKVISSATFRLNCVAGVTLLLIAGLI